MEKCKLQVRLDKDIFDKFIWLMEHNNRNRTLQLKQLIVDAYNRQKESE